MTYNLGPVKPWTQAAAEEIGAKFGIKTIYGWRAKDPYPDHPAGLADDFMISDIPNGHQVGENLAAYVIANAQRLGVKYIIWNRRSWNPQRGTWVAYTGTNPHTDHVHVTFNATAPAGGTVVDTQPVGIVGDTWAQFKNLASVAAWLSNTRNYARVSVAVFGAILVLIVIYKVVKQTQMGSTVISTVSDVVTG